MSKYIIDLPDNVKKLVYFHVGNANAIWITSNNLDDLEELNSDYINENFGELQDEAYKRGYEDGKDSTEKGCEGCKYESVKEGEPPCRACSKAYKNRYTPAPHSDRIKVGDEVEWNGIVIVITRFCEDGEFNWCDGIGQDGRVFRVLAENVRKTDKHYDIQSILEAMRNG